MVRSYRQDWPLSRRGAIRSLCLYKAMVVRIVSGSAIILSGGGDILIGQQSYSACGMPYKADEKSLTDIATLAVLIIASAIHSSDVGNARYWCWKQGEGEISGVGVRDWSSHLLASFVCESCFAYWIVAALKSSPTTVSSAVLLAPISYNTSSFCGDAFFLVSLLGIYHVLRSDLSVSTLTSVRGCAWPRFQAPRFAAHISSQTLPQALVLGSPRQVDIVKAWVSIFSKEHV
jgi:hypothetical protein